MNKYDFWNIAGILADIFHRALYLYVALVGAFALHKYLGW